MMSEQQSSNNIVEKWYSFLDGNGYVLARPTTHTASTTRLCIT